MTSGDGENPSKGLSWQADKYPGLSRMHHRCAHEIREAVIMVKITMEIEGMACAMCEAHINDAVRKAFPVKKSNHHTEKEKLR